MVVGTSAMIETELDSIVNQYTDKFCNPVVLLRTKSVVRDSSEIHFFQALVNAHAERTETKKKRTIADSLCDSGGIQTHNLLIRSQMLYSVELRNLSWRLISELRVQRYNIFFRLPNFFAFEF